MTPVVKWFDPFNFWYSKGGVCYFLGYGSLRSKVFLCFTTFLGDGTGQKKGGIWCFWVMSHQDHRLLVFYDFPHPMKVELTTGLFCLGFSTYSFMDYMENRHFWSCFSVFLHSLVFPVSFVACLILLWVLQLLSSCLMTCPKSFLFSATLSVSFLKIQDKWYNLTSFPCC